MGRSVVIVSLNWCSKEIGSDDMKVGGGETIKVIRRQQDPSALFLSFPLPFASLDSRYD